MTQMEMNLPPFQRHSETSREAAESMVSASATQRQKILNDMEKNPRGWGITIDEAAVLLDCQTGTASARIRDLEKANLIHKAGELTRLTRSDRRAQVYHLGGAR